MVPCPEGRITKRLVLEAIILCEKASARKKKHVKHAQSPRISLAVQKVIPQYIYSHKSILGEMTGLIDWEMAGFRPAWLCATSGMWWDFQSRAAKRHLNLKVMTRRWGGTLARVGHLRSNLYPLSIRWLSIPGILEYFLIPIHV